jgi:beta-lactamase class A
LRDIADVLRRWRGEARGSRLLRDGRERLAAVLAGFAEADEGRSIGVACLREGGGIEGARLDVRRPGASTLKIAVVAAVLKEADAGRIDLDESVAAGDLAGSKWPGIADSLDGRTRLRLIDLCALAIASSDNPAADFLTRRVGMAGVAEWLRAAGCSGETRVAAGYSDGAIESVGRSNTLTVADSVRLLRAVFVDAVYDPLLRFLLNNVRNQRIPRLLDDTIWVAHKTGSLAGVVNDIGIVFSRDDAFILSVLCDGQADTLAAEHDIARLSADIVTMSDA